MSLSVEKQAILQSSFQKVTGRTDFFIKTFYDTLWELAPETKTFFKDTNMVRQGKKLMMIFAHIFGALDNTDEMANVMRDVGGRHIHYGVNKELFDIMETTIIQTLEKVLEEDFNGEVEQAWREVIHIMVNAAVSAY